MAPRTLATIVIALVAAACSKPPPPEVPVEPPAPPPKVEAPPPPKCETMLEACKAKADTRAKIPKSTFAFTPPPGWIYVLGDSATRAQIDDEGAALVVTAYASDADAKKELPLREAAFAQAAKELNLNVAKLKVNWKKPDDKKPLKGAGATANLWQLDGAGVRGAKKGPLLVVQAPLPDGKALIVIGFVPDDDKSKSDELILQSVDSVAPGDAGK